MNDNFPYGLGVPMFELGKIVAPAALVAGMLLPASAGALTIKIDDGNGTSITVVDGDGNDADGAVGSIAYLADVGGALIGITSTWLIDELGQSLLGLVVTDSSALQHDIRIDASHTGFGEGAGSPTNVVFSMNAGTVQDICASECPKSGTLLGYAAVDTTNSLFGATNAVGVGFITGSTPADGIYSGISTALSDPFSMQIKTVIYAGTYASYDASLIAAVPLPAGGLLLLGALGGLGLARRRRSAEPALA